MKIVKWLLPLLLIIVAVYFLGPLPVTPQLDTQIQPITTNLIQLEEEINTKESQNPNIREDNQARIIWANDTIKEKTPYSLVYLHGFSSSQQEGDPLHISFAKRYGCNLYLSRLQSHGITAEEPLLDLTPENYVASAKEAIAIGKALGEKVILMSTSTGGTLGIYLAQNDPDIAGLINYSPNIRVFDPKASLLVKPWGLQLARLVMGSKYNEFDGPPIVHQVWTTKYRLESVVALQSLLEATMVEETFQNVKTPFFLGYYYKNEQEQDHVVSVTKMLEMFDQLGTPDNLKRKVAFPNAGNHCIAADIRSKAIDRVKEETFKFAEEILGLQAIE